MFLPSDITLRPGDSGEHVSELQRRLTQRELLGGGNISGFFDGPTTQAVMGFQGLNGLRTDGVAGPETLRRLVSIGVSDEGSASGSQSEEEEKAEYVNPEMADEYALAAEQAEEKKLANEAVWGYGEEVAAEQTQGQQQLADLDHYNEVHNMALAQEAALHDQQAALQAEQIDETIEVNKPEQLKIDQEGMKAHTLGEEIERVPEHEKNPEHEAEASKEASIDRLPDAPLHEAPQEVMPEQEATPVVPAAPRDPELERTEAQLDVSSRQESAAEGQNLEKKGIKNRGNVPENELGELTPDQTPGQQREREVMR